MLLSVYRTPKLEFFCIVPSRQNSSYKHIENIFTEIQFWGDTKHHEYYYGCEPLVSFLHELGVVWMSCILPSSERILLLAVLVMVLRHSSRRIGRQWWLCSATYRVFVGAKYSTEIRARLIWQFVRRL